MTIFYQWFGTTFQFIGVNFRVLIAQLGVHIREDGYGICITSHSSCESFSGPKRSNLRLVKFTIIFNW